MYGIFEQLCDTIVLKVVWEADVQGRLTWTVDGLGRIAWKDGSSWKVVSDDDSYDTISDMEV